MLAAGTSSRAGKQKLVADFRGRPMIEYAIAAAGRWRPLVVAGAEVAAYLAGRTDVELVRNDEPQRGMSHSLALANLALPEQIPIVVLLGDKPLVSEALIATICDAAGDADFVYPITKGEPGHPVWLSASARARIAVLPEGDTLRTLRDDATLVARAVETADPGASFDVDTID
ncbi:MAG TPA: NTP transferase domain-containing protein [Candidatus Nitrosotalea sp.]|nr:NTP transferase domain-containing protein [Candidatus Nitrosotalea sp.]